MVGGLKQNKIKVSRNLPPKKKKRGEVKIAIKEEIPGHAFFKISSLNQIFLFTKHFKNGIFTR